MNSLSTRKSSWLSWLDLALLVVAVACLVARFVRLESNPPLLALDEWLAAAHLACLNQAGQSIDGKPWPLFAYGFGGGFYTPTFLYAGLLWTKLFGISVEAMRAMVAAFNVATILGAGAIGLRLGGPRVALWTVVLGSLSPWSFQFSRILWDPPLAPAFLVWCVYFWFMRRPWLAGALSGLMFVAAVYSYPPTRVQAPLLFACLFLLTFRKSIHTLKKSVAFAVASVPLALPLLYRLFSSEFTDRGNDLSIFAKSYIAANRGEHGGLEYFIFTFLDNLALHFRPSFLFFKGDGHPRHSTQHFGELGWLDGFALACGLLMVVAALINLRRQRESRFLQAKDLQLLLISLAGLVFGIVPAALTWEAIPHALRSIGAWPFVCLFGALLLSMAEQHWAPFVRAGALAIACLFAASFGQYYFVDYPRHPATQNHFSVPTYEAAANIAKASPETRADIARKDAPLVRYLMMSNGTHSCLESETVRKLWLKK
jgi:hypothetical protein